MLTAIRTVPVTVPINKVVLDGNTASVPFAGIVKVTVLVSLEKRVIGSSLGFSALDANVKTSWPARALGVGDVNESAMSCAALAANVAGRPFTVNGARGGSIVRV